MLLARSTLTLAVAALFAAHAGEAWAQGALKPVDALIVNPDSRPVPVKDSRIVQPYQHSVVNAGCTSGVCEVQFPVVPAGKRLVISHASAEFSIPTTEVPFFRLATSAAAGEPVVVLLPQTAGPPVGPVGALRQYYVAGGPVTVYVAAGAAPVVRLGGFGATSATAALVGYLVDAP